MFQFPGSPRPRLCVRRAVPGRSPGRVPPFGDPRVRGRLRLTAAYRSLPRPSSSSCAKASAVRPTHLPRSRGAGAIGSCFFMSIIRFYRPRGAGDRLDVKNSVSRIFGYSRISSYEVFPLCACQGARMASARKTSTLKAGYRGRSLDEAAHIPSKPEGSLRLEERVSLERR